MEVHKILLISTGGTIAGRVAHEEGENETTKDAENFAQLIAETKARIREIWQLDLEVTPNVLYDEDSSDILPLHWMGIVELIEKEYDNYHSFVITHGTNTMGYTSAALSFALENVGKPIVITGSQVPQGDPGSDAKLNLDNAIRVAAWPHQPQIKGVVVVFGSHIITGTRAKKSTEFDYDAFQSFTTGNLGRIGRVININKENLEKHLGYLKTRTYNIALSSKDLRVHNDFNINIASITEFPGMTKEFLIKLAKTGIKGLIIRAFGAGDISTHLHEAFEYYDRMKIPVVVTTQAPNGNSNLQVNEPGVALIKQDIVIPAYDMSIESQTAKLAWLLAKKDKDEIRYEDIKRELVRDTHGEINVLIELKQ